MNAILLETVLCIYVLMRQNNINIIAAGPSRARTVTNADVFEISTWSVAWGLSMAALMCVDNYKNDRTANSG
jgi:hypothetical protein